MHVSDAVCNRMRMARVPLFFFCVLCNGRCVVCDCFATQQPGERTEVVTLKTVEHRSSGGPLHAADACCAGCH